jgi:hypothetical protein
MGNVEHQLDRGNHDQRPTHPEQGLVLTHFLTVRDVARSRDFYADIFVADRQEHVANDYEGAQLAARARHSRKGNGPPLKESRR